MKQASLLALALGVGFVLGMLGMHGWTELMSRRNVGSAIRSELAAEATGPLRYAKLLGTAGPLTVIASEDDADVQALHVFMNGRRLVRVRQYEWCEDHLFATIYYADGKPFVTCGRRDEGAFPGFLMMYPATGPDAGKLGYGDYDLDGVYEKREQHSPSFRIYEVCPSVTTQNAATSQPGNDTQPRAATE